MKDWRQSRWLAITLLIATGGVARAERLLKPRIVPDAPDARAVAPGIGNLRSLALDTRALKKLRAKTAATLTDLPLGPDTIPSATVTRFEPFSPGARVDLVEAGGVRHLTLPDQLYYRGRVDGDPDSLVVVVAAPDAVHGVVQANGTVYRFGPDRTGTYRSWALRDADPATFPIPPPFCGEDALGMNPQRQPGRLRVPVEPLAARSAAYSPPLLVEVALDTDEEFLDLFQTGAGALAYLADLVANVSAIYDADVGVRVVFRYIRLWATTDPWTATSASFMVFETSSYWNNYETATPRDLMHFISGKAVVGGAAWLGGLCSSGYGASTVYGAFDVLNPSDTWDVSVVAHELGHNLGSEHTHCYNPPLDHCYSGESHVCYNGPVEVPPGGGTLMSYCHTFSGGMANVNLTFGPTVSAVLRASVENGICVGPPCGDGRLDPGEECDDGNVADGDCCTSSCTAAPDGGSCDDGNACTTSGTCVAGTCGGVPVADGSPCDDGKVCTSDACVAGSCVGLLGPANGCRAAQPLKSYLRIKDAGGTSFDNKLMWTWAKGQETTAGDLGDPLLNDGYEFCIYDAQQALVFSGRVPAGGTCYGVPCWKVGKGSTYTFKNRDVMTLDGMQKLTLHPGTTGKARMAVTGKGAKLVIPDLLTLNLPLRAQLHGAGRCWENTFSTPYVSERNWFKAKSD